MMHNSFSEILSDDREQLAVHLGFLNKQNRLYVCDYIM